MYFDVPGHFAVRRLKRCFNVLFWGDSDGMTTGHYLGRSSSSAGQEMGFPMWILSASQVRHGSMVPFLLPWNFSWRATERMTFMTHMAEKASMCHVYVRQLKCIYNKNWTLQFVINNIVYNKCHQCQPFCDGYSSTYWSLPMSIIVSVLPVFQGHSSIKQPPEYNGCC